MGLLHDDTTAAIRAWIDRRTGELPGGFRSGVRAWLVVLLDGDARTRPRSPTTLRVHFGILRPFIERWAATRGHLREITSGDVDAILEPLRGHQRYNAITALRSLFRFARRHGLTFADPTRHLEGGRGAGRTVLPMTAGQIRAVQQAAVTPAQRLAVALAAVHAARPRAIRELTLDDIDLRHLPRAHPARPHPGRSPGHRCRPFAPDVGLQHRPHQRDGLCRRRPQPSQRPGRTGTVTRAPGISLLKPGGIKLPHSSGS